MILTQKWNISTAGLILDELSQDSVTQTYGYDMAAGMKKITVRIFWWRDILIVGKIREAAAILTNIAIQRFHEISLSLNSDISVSISIEHDHLDERPLSINSYHNIRSLQKDEKKMWIDFSDKILLHAGRIAKDLKHNLDLPIGSPLLKAEQKFSVPAINFCSRP